MRKHLARLTGGLASLLGLAAAPAALSAQKALVYCPAADTRGCDAVAAALTASFPDGVDRASDVGTGVDLRTADLFQYAVFVVPSLADNATSQPYAFLRDATVAHKLKDALMGRHVFYSGTPDQGTSNRDAKNALLVNLARNAASNFGAARGPGLVVLQDFTETASARYDWLRAITGVNLTADPALMSYASVRAVTATGTEVLTSSGSLIAYANMAMYGFQLPTGAAGVTLDAIGQTGTTQGGQVVLASMAGVSASGATIMTDKDDYAPGTTVVMTGAGFQAGETVNLVLHEDPEQHAPRTFTVTVNGQGGFTFTGFAPEEHDLGVRFILTATGSASGAKAQTTFTDAVSINSPNGISPASGPTAGGTVVTITGGGFGSSPTVSFGGTAGVVNAAQSNGSTIVVTTPAHAAGQVNVVVTAGGSSATVVNGFTFGATCTAAAISTQPTAQSIVYGTDATFTAAANGSPAPSVKWQSSPNGSTWTDVAGAISTTLSLSKPTVAQSGTQYRAVFTNSCSTVNSNAVSLTVTPKALTVAGVTAGSRQYDGTTAATLNTASATLNGIVGTDAVTLDAGAATGTFADKNIGTGKTVTVAGLALSGAAAGNYSVTQPTATADITAKSLTGSFTAASKPYDGNTSATITTRGVAGAVGSEDVTLAGGTATFADASAGTGKTVTGTGFTLAGTDKANYTLASSTLTTLADITKASQTIAFAQPDNPTYGGPTLQLSATASSGLTPVFTASGTACSLGSGGAANVLSATGAGTCTVTASQPGDNNFTAAPNVQYTLTVAQKSISVGTVTVANKVYDGTTAAAITGRALSDGSKVGGDEVTLTGGVATFADKTVGNGKSVTVTGLTLGGAQAANYVLASASTTSTANITALTVTPTLTIANKQYDATTAATVATATIAGAITNDQVSLTGATATFADKSVGTAKPVSISGLSLTGTDAGNYVLSTTTTSATADITAKALAVGTVTVADKIYDGNTSATITTRSLASGGVIGTDAVTLDGGTATFATKSVGTSKPVNVTGLTLGGGDAGNYSLSAGTATSSANITAKSVTAAITASDKPYDGTTDAQAAGTLAGTVVGDAVTVAVSGAAFNTKDVGTGKPVTATVALNGADAGNYALTATTAATTASITAKALTIASVAAADKVYDGNTTATLTGAVLGAGVVAGDAASLSGGTASFDSKSVGTGKTVTASGFTLTGAQAGNYSLTATTATTTANITAKAITGSSIAADNKTYDGTRTATVNGTLGGGKVGGDDLSLEVSGALFDTKDVGTAKTVTATLALGGTDAGNYTLGAATTASTTAAITAKALVGGFTANNKVYDATTAATVSTKSLPGVISPDDVTLTVTGAAFANKNVGTGKTVSANLALGGAGAGNYTVNPTATATADITPATVTGSFTASNKVYDGGTAATISGRTISSGVLPSDQVTLENGSATFADKNAGSGKTVTGTGFTLGGADGGNYVLGPVPSTTASITPASLTPSFTASSKVYDASTAATIATRSLAGIIGSDVVMLTDGAATFDNRNVGTGKTVTATGFTLGGAGAGNYVLNVTTATATADITKAAVTASVTAQNKVYDGSTSATVAAGANGGLTGILGTDAVTLSIGTATFASKTVGTGKTVTVAVALAGGDAGNYAVGSPVTTTADITARTLVVSATGVNKTYDGTTSATVTLSDNRVTGDVLTPAYTSATFADRNAGTGKTVSVAGISISGTDAGNYTANTTAMATANIAVRSITVKAKDVSKFWGESGMPAYDIELAASSPSPLGTGDALTDLGVPAFSTTPAAPVDAGVYPITVSGLVNGNYAIGYATGSAMGALTIVDKTAPTANVTELLPVPLNTSATLKVNLTDVMTGNSPIVAWKISVDDAYGAEKPVTPALASVNLTETLTGSATTDVRKICVMGRDAGGNWSPESCALLAIYDPNGGFVTGGGWINSPAGALVANPAAIGKANFGFVSKYQKGQQLPGGDTEFQFKAGDLNFKSRSYEWLVISGARAQYKGEGTINGSGTYGFLLTAIDGQVSGGGGADKFRLKIWEKATGNIVYDNQMTAPDDATPTTGLGGGSIQIQSK